MSTGKTSSMTLNRPEKRVPVITTAKFDTRWAIVPPMKERRPFDLGNPGWMLQAALEEKDAQAEQVRAA